MHTPAKWLKFRKLDPDSLSHLYEVSTTQQYRMDAIISPRRFLRRCVLVSTKRNASYSFVSEVSRYIST